MKILVYLCIIPLIYTINSTCYLSNITELSVFRNFIAGTIALGYDNNNILITYRTIPIWNISNSSVTITIHSNQNSSALYQNQYFSAASIDSQSNNSLNMLINIPAITDFPTEVYITYQLWLYTRGPIQTNGGDMVYDTDQYAISGGQFYYDLYECNQNAETTTTTTTLDTESEDYVVSSSNILQNSFMFG
jgi:hypothetical protein